ncbi:unnamed protein product [Amoebophrya sp. A25]|nr:unnamed protein product [Amoebophrya sp. A25]|eukprot:GSA25T00001958001.1
MAGEKIKAEESTSGVGLACIDVVSTSSGVEQEDDGTSSSATRSLFTAAAPAVATADATGASEKAQDEAAVDDKELLEKQAEEKSSTSHVGSRSSSKQHADVTRAKNNEVASNLGDEGPPGSANFVKEGSAVAVNSGSSSIVTASAISSSSSRASSKTVAVAPTKTKTKKNGKNKPNVWVLKPGLFANRGCGIEIMTDLSKIQAHLRKKIHKTPFLVQKYIEKPFLVDGRKFDIRAYALVVDECDDIDAAAPAVSQGGGGRPVSSVLGSGGPESKTTNTTKKATTESLTKASTATPIMGETVGGTNASLARTEVEGTPLATPDGAISSETEELRLPNMRTPRDEDHGIPEGRSEEDEYLATLEYDDPYSPMIRTASGWQPNARTPLMSPLLNGHLTSPFGSPPATSVGRFSGEKTAGANADSLVAGDGNQRSQSRTLGRLQKEAEGPAGAIHSGIGRSVSSSSASTGGSSGAARPKSAAAKTCTYEIYFYVDYYIRTTSTTYTCSDFENRLKHLNNDAVQKHGKDYGKFESANKLSVADFQKYLEQHYPSYRTNGPTGFNVDHLTAQIKQHMETSFRAGLPRLNPRRVPGCFEVFGFDFMLDSDFRCWLIEINTNPCLELCNANLATIIPPLIESSIRKKVFKNFGKWSHKWERIV